MTPRALLPTEATHNFYSDAEVYDILHTPGTKEEVDTLERIERRYLPVPGSRAGHARSSNRRRSVWLEPACGTGRLLREAAARGKRVIGFDLEPNMISYAKQWGKQRGARLFVAAMEDFADRLRPSSVDFAFNPINTIRHLGSDRALLSHFAGIARVLRPHGVYAVGISLAAYGLEQETEDVWTGTRGRVRVVQVVQYIPAMGRRGEGSRTERVFSHLTISRPTGDTHADSTYGLRSYDLAQWKHVIARSALEVAEVLDSDGEPTHPVEPGYAVWVLRPRKSA